jgi:hypothetical protein
MPCLDRCRWGWIALALSGLLAACGGGNSTVTTVIGGPPAEVVASTPTGANTTEIVVDAGPSSGFSLGAVNIPYVTVKVCAPGSSTQCATIDHVMLDTGSIGLRLLKSRVAALNLPAVAAPTPSTGNAAECFQFVLGALWGPLAQVDLYVGGESAPGLLVHVIDDQIPTSYPAPADCVKAGLLSTVDKLQANGVLGVGQLAFDCGLPCINGDVANPAFKNGGYPYFSCDAAACTPVAVPISQQVQHPVVHFAMNSDQTIDNNGTLIVLPALSTFGAGMAKGRLVFGIGTQTNNQLPPTAKVYMVDADPAHDATYLSLMTQSGGATYSGSYIDSGSNGLFFDDASIPLTCKSNATSGAPGTGWYCPTTTLQRTATITDYPAQGAVANSGTVDYSVGNADELFAVSSLALPSLAGSVGQGRDTFVWGLPFFFGRSVFTSIWGQPLSTNGPWNAF